VLPTARETGVELHWRRRSRPPISRVYSTSFLRP
jgi:hypothetical protein